jgi:hypothetical protein
MVAPALESFLINGLVVVAGIADIMVAGYSPKSHAQTVHEFGSVPEILFDVGAIDSDVAGMDDEEALQGLPLGGARRARRRHDLDLLAS